MNNTYKSKKITVTGGTGFIGANLVKKLLEEGASVKVIADDMSRNVFKDVEYIKADLRDLNQSINALNGSDMVFHLAAFGFGAKANKGIQAEMLTYNLLMNTNVLEAAHKAGAEKYLFASSIAVYEKDSQYLDDARGILFKDDPEPHEKYYGWAKRTGEVQCRAYYDLYDMKCAIVRFSNPYGMHDLFDLQRSHVLPAFILKALASGDKFLIEGNPNATRNFVFIDDVITAVLAVVDKYAVCDPVNVCSEKNTSIYELAEATLFACGKENKKIETKQNISEKLITRQPLVNKLKEKTGFVPKTELKEGIKQTVKWYEEFLAG